MVKRYVVPIAILIVVMASGEFLSSLLPRPHAEIELASDRLGWTEAIDSHEVALDVFDRVNDERRERGLPALAWHDGLAQRARAWSEEMIATGYRHSDADWRHHPDFAGSGENIYMGPTSSRELHIGWMKSDGHRDNILHPAYTAIGIGVVCRNDGRMWATQMFGSPPSGAATNDEPTTPRPLVRRDLGLTCEGREYGLDGVEHGG